MYAIIETGGKQYRVEEGTKVKVETLPHDIGKVFNLERILLIGQEAGTKVGQPLVAGAIVTAEVVTHDRAKKIIVFKKRSKKTYKKTQGHRQNYTELLIKSIAA
jgi:large subunit ribosomal protein L21